MFKASLCCLSKEVKSICCLIELQALMTTKYVFEDLPPMLNPAPSTEVNPEQTEDEQHWEKYQYEDLESSCDDM